MDKGEITAHIEREGFADLHVIRIWNGYAAVIRLAGSKPRTRLQGRNWIEHTDVCHMPAALKHAL